MPRKPTAKRALPESFGQKSTKGGGGKVIKKGSTGPTKRTTKSSGGVQGVRPGGVVKSSTVLGHKQKKK